MPNWWERNVLRREGIAALVRRLDNEPVIANLGPATFDLYASGDPRREPLHLGRDGAGVVHRTRRGDRRAGPQGVRHRRRWLAADEPRLARDDSAAGAAEPRAHRVGQPDVVRDGRPADAHFDGHPTSGGSREPQAYRTLRGRLPSRRSRKRSTRRYASRGRGSSTSISRRRASLVSARRSSWKRTS